MGDILPRISMGSLKVYILKPEEKRRQRKYSILLDFSLCLDKLVVRHIVSHYSVTPHSQIMALPCK